MANNNGNDRWYFTKDQLDATPSRKCGYNNYKELSYRQQTANFIQDMGQRLKVSQLCINTAIVYMHRFYVFHSFTNFPWHQMAAAALFLAAKVEEQPRKLEYVIRVANMCRNSKDTNIDVNSERYLAQSQDLVFNENVLLQTLGFDVAIDHPHTHVVRCCHLVKASKDLAQSSYFLASNSLHLTTMCLQYKPTVVACFCIHLACKWSSWEIPLSKEKKEWFLYVDPTVTAELLQQLTEEFLSIFESCPSRLKEKIMAIGDIGMHNAPNTIVNSPFDTDPKKILPPEGKDAHSHRSAHDGKSGDDLHKHRSGRPHESGGSSGQQQKEREYREKREREKMAAAQHGLKPVPSQTKPPAGAHGHHRSTGAPPVDPKAKQHARPLPAAPGNGGTTGNVNRTEPRDILREATRDSPFGIATKDPPGVETTPKDPKSVKGDAHGHNNGDKQSGRSGCKMAAKHEQGRRHDDKPFARPPSNNNVKVKSPFEHVKQVARPAQAPARNQNGGAYESLPAAPAEIKEEKRGSLFSPEKSPHQAGRRARNSSTGSEPELRPVLKKIDQVEGFENLMRDASIDDKGKADEPVTAAAALPTYSKEMRPPDIIPPLCPDPNDGPASAAQPAVVNGRETDPALISSLLKEAPTVPHLLPVGNDGNHHHHKNKKKNKEKHKHKDKSRDDKEKKKKHKDKDREKRKHTKQDGAEGTGNLGNTEPIKITIMKDKIQSVPNPLKIKIQKTKEIKEEVAPPVGLKIKIPKDKIGNAGAGVANSTSSRKRERDRGSLPSPSDGPPPVKLSRSGHNNSVGKQNGRHSTMTSSSSGYATNKVTQLGDGDASVHRLAESKYINKNSS